MSNIKEAGDNPLHRDFGMLRNTAYVLGRTRKYCPVLLPLGLVNMIFGSVQGYFWGFMSKFVIDIITSPVLQADKQRNLILTVVITAASAFLIYGTNTFVGSKLWPRFMKVRIGVIHECEEKAMNLNYEQLERPETLDIHQRAQRATGSNDEGFEGMLHKFGEMGTHLVTALAAFIAVTVLDVRLISALTVLTLCSFAFYRYTIRKDKEEVWDRLTPVWRKIRYMSRVTQHFDYAKDIRLFSMKNFLLGKQRRIHEIREERMDAHYDMWKRYACFGQLLNVISRVLIYSVLYFAVLDRSRPMSIGNFTLYISFAMAFSTALLLLLQRIGDYSRDSMKVDDLRSFLELEDDTPADTLPVPESDGYEIIFHDVAYQYHQSDRNAVEHLNLTLHPGERLAVVGLNGAGKTTMIKLLLRLYDPTEGCITLNGTDIRRFRRADYYRLFSPVFQKTEVFAASLGDNISLMTASETDRSRAEACMEQAGLLEKLNSLPRGLDTEVLKVVADDGIDLSGGEKQKLALARALYKGAPIVVLDEPTAALDALAEKQLYERFDGMIGQKSAVYISHRLASTRFCDHIAMFREGRMCEYGTHDELIAQNGEYARMFDVQARYYRDHPEDGEVFV